MRELAGTVLDPQSVVGSGAFVAATKRMELGALAPLGMFVAPPDYALETPIVEQNHGASSPMFSVPVVLRTQHVSADYVNRFFIDPARVKRAVMEMLAQSLEHDTEHLSVVRRAARHPAFRQLSELGPAAATVALEHLKGTHRPLWLFFLQRTTGEHPAADVSSVDDAAELWREWGRERGLA